MTVTAARTAATWIRAFRRLALALVASAVGTSTLAGCHGPAPPRRIGEGAGDASGYQRAFDDAGGAEAIGRPTTVVQEWGTGCRQLFAGGMAKAAALLQWPCGPNQQVFAVSGDFWDVYRARGDLAPLTYGFPAGPRGEWQGGWTQGFGQRGGVDAFFMQRPGQPPHVLSPPMLLFYLSFDDRATRFGYPTGNQVPTGAGRSCQAFEQAVVTAAGDGTFDVVPGRGACGAR